MAGKDSEIRCCDSCGRDTRAKQYCQRCAGRIFWVDKGSNINGKSRSLDALGGNSLEEAHNDTIGVESEDRYHGDALD
jgi:hypothetical protein